MKIWPNPIPSQNLYYRLFPLTPTYIMGGGPGAGRSITSNVEPWAIYSFYLTSGSVYRLLHRNYIF